MYDKWVSENSRVDFLHEKLPTANFQYFTSSNKDSKIIYEK